MFDPIEKAYEDILFRGTIESINFSCNEKIYVISSYRCIEGWCSDCLGKSELFFGKSREEVLDLICEYLKNENSNNK